MKQGRRVSMVISYAISTSTFAWRADLNLTSAVSLNSLFSPFWPHALDIVWLSNTRFAALSVCVGKCVILGHCACLVSWAGGPLCLSLSAFVPPCQTLAPIQRWTHKATLKSQWQAETSHGYMHIYSDAQRVNRAQEKGLEMVVRHCFSYQHITVHWNLSNVWTKATYRTSTSSVCVRVCAFSPPSLTSSGMYKYTPRPYLSSRVNHKHVWSCILFQGRVSGLAPVVSRIHARAHMHLQCHNGKTQEKGDPQLCAQRWRGGPLFLCLNTELSISLFIHVWLVD